MWNQLVKRTLWELWVKLAELEPKKLDALTGYSPFTAALFLAWEPQMHAVFFLRTTRLRIVWLIVEISTKRIHTEEKIKEIFTYLPTDSMIYHTLLFDHIGNDKCPNDSRRIMPFVAHLVRRRKVYALKNSSDSLSCAALNIF